MALRDIYLDCIKMNKKVVSTPSGGNINLWSDGVEIKAAIGQNTSGEAIQAMKSEGKLLYSILIEPKYKIEHDDYIKVKKDGRFLRITSLNRDTPHIASMVLKQFYGEYVTELPK